jgi:flagellar hook-associated protein 3 FlgL
MGGSLNNISDNISYALNLHAKALANLQEQASTGSQINRASDDPSTAYQVLGLNSQQRDLENYMDNISETSSTLEISSSIVQDIISTINETKVQLTQIISGSYNQDGRTRLAEGVNDTLEELVSLANTRHMGQYLFSGTSTNTAAYLAQRTNGEITSVTYQGSFQNRSIEIASGVESNAFHVGDEIFHSNDREGPVIVGDTGAATGAGTANIQGDAWLTVTHNGSNYELSIDGGATKVTVPLAGDVSNIAVTDANGRVLYVDATNIASTGVDLVRVPGTYDVFNSLITIRDLLKNSQGFSEEKLTELRNNAIASLEEVRGLMVEKAVSIGSRIGFLGNLKNTLENVKFDTEDQATLLQEADIVQIAIDISRREVLYRMSLSVAGRLMSMSLLDFIR